MPIKIAIIAGTRPELIKLSPLLKLISNDLDFSLLFIHAGQHYDSNLSEVFLYNLNLPLPNIYIESGSGTHGYQTGTLLMKIERILLENKPDIVLAEGDTNTVLASALATRKINKCFMHLEAGIRSFDKRMPEEINRILTASCTMYHLVPTERSALNLIFEGIDPKSIFITGNTIVDAVLQNKDIAQSKSKIIETLKIDKNKSVILITLHRPSNVDNKESLEKFIDTLIELQDFYFIFPIHPRTRKNLKNFDLLHRLVDSSNIQTIEPLGYLDFLKVFSKSICVITDSGGIQEEASILRIPSITLRNNTERPETLNYGSNVLIGRDMNKLKSELLKIKSDSTYLRGKLYGNPFGDGKTSKRIVDLIKKLYNQNKLNFEQSKLWDGVPTRIYKKIENQDANKTVNNFEIENNLIIQLIYDKTGIPYFPYENRLLEKEDTILINFFKKTA